LSLEQNDSMNKNACQIEPAPYTIITLLIGTPHLHRPYLICANWVDAWP
jgi:hypothetical protein